MQPPADIDSGYEPDHEYELDLEPYPGYWADVDADAAMFVPPDPVDAVTGFAATIALQQAQQYSAVAALRRDAMARAAGRGVRARVDSMVDRSVRLELACALRITEHAAGELLARATALVDQYPSAWEALHDGNITDQHVRYLVDLLSTATPEVAARVSERAVQLAIDLPAGMFRRALRALLEEAAAPTLTERHQQALTQRRVWVDPASDGMAYLTAHLPAVEAHAVFDRLTRMGKTIVGRHAGTGARDGADPDTGDDARTDASDGAGTDAAAVGVDDATAGPDPRTLDQVRADMLCDLLIDGTCDGHSGAARGIRPTVVVTVPVLSLLDDAQAATAPATVEGLGPIPIDTARVLCGGGADWMRVLTHPETGMVLSVGRTRYTPPPELKRLIRWRSGRCMAPGCTAPASRCEIDHNHAWHEGGHTCLDNNCPFCTGHHHVKHDGGWTVRQIPDSGGVIEWISPYGRRYLVEPERRVPVFRAQPEHEPAPF
ncbi:MAG: HNH endonuclease [Microbacterium sp.]|nr:MAG: HNH endonuclease [Microbacterium sp.]